MNDSVGPPEIVRILPEAIRTIRDEARRTFPYECCGFLFGKRDGGKVDVLKVFPSKNISSSDRSSHYELSPVDFVKATEEHEAYGLEFIGFFHSHPNFPAVPSANDRRRPWPDVLYTIVSVRDDACEIRHWWYEGGEGEFFEIKWETFTPVSPTSGQG